MNSPLIITIALLVTILLVIAGWVVYSLVLDARDRAGEREAAFRHALTGNTDTVAAAITTAMTAMFPAPTPVYPFDSTPQPNDRNLDLEWSEDDAITQDWSDTDLPTDYHDPILPPGMTPLDLLRIEQEREA